MSALRPLLTQALGRAEARRRQFVQPHSGHDAAAAFYEARGFANGVAAAMEFLNPETPNDDPTLFDPGLVPANRCYVQVSRYAPGTSRDAAITAFPRSGTQRMKVLDLVGLRADYGATDEELQVDLGMGHNSQTPRRRELVLGGWIEDSGRTRATASTGAQATVWVLSEQAKKEWPGA